MTMKPLVIACSLLPCWPALAAEACQDLPAQSPGVWLAGLDASGDPLLVDGRRLRLVGLAPRQDAAETARFARAIEAWRGQELILVMAGSPDRWGRLPSRLLISDDDSPAELRDLATVLLEAGAAARLPEAAHAGCGVPARAGKPTPASPAGASAVKIEPAISPGALDGHDIVALKAHEGRLAVVEGRVASIGERPQRVYLNFSRRRGEAGAITMSRKLWREMQDAGWTAAALSGKRVKAHGILSGRDGLLLEMTSVLALELID